MTFASYPLRRGGSCGPSRALEDLPAGGALVFVVEYYARGATARRQFPPRPAAFRLPRGGARPIECMGPSGWILSFTDAGRHFEAFAFLGPHARTARRGQLERVLDSLRFRPTTPHPRDPTLDWRDISDLSGDGIHVPPHWLGIAVRAPRPMPRPRTLFLLTSRRLRGLPRPDHDGQVRRVPSPVHTPGLRTLRGVVTWVVEAKRGRPGAAFRPLPAHRSWPRPSDFSRVGTGPARRWPKLVWRRAGGSWRRYRFSIWIASASGAPAADLRRAMLAARTFGFSTLR